MNMIEVDPKLFITCRLCVEETGVYQIVPEVQKKIKYCFDLNISLLDGLPPLICKKCELMLSNHAQIKDMLHEKQKKLIKKFKENPIKENITEEPTSKLPTQQIDIQNNDANHFNENKKEVTCKKKKLKNHRTSSIDKSSSQVNNTEPVPIKNVNKSAQNGWRKNYKRQFVCRFCSISLLHKKSMICHSERCVLLQKYADVYKWCWVQVTNINSKSNLTGSTDHIVYERNKIVNTKNPNYYVIYSMNLEKKKSSSESSDENFVRSKRKRKRQRLISESSNETLVIDNVLDKENNKTVFTAPSDIECVTLDDSDNASTVSTATVKPDTSRKFTNERLLNSIVSICHNKYLKRYNNGGNYIKSCDSDDSLLQRKLLSIGTKIIHKDGFNQTGLLRYMEQKDLDVTWIPKLETNVSVRTTLKANKQNVDENNLKSLSLIDNNYKSRDFVDIFEQKCTSEADSTNSNLIFSNNNTVQEELTNIQMECVLSNNNIDSSSNDIVHNTDMDSVQKTNVMDTHKVINTYEKVIKNNVLHLHAPKGTMNVCKVKKLLNPNPVANPKKLTKKAVSELTTNCNRHDDTNVIYTTAENSTDIDICSRLPIITSTVSLAPSVNNVDISEPSPPINEAAPTTSEAPLPRIKVKPVSELMAAATEKPKGAPVPASVWAGNSNEVQKQFIPNILPSLLLSSNSVYVNLVEPNNMIYPQIQNSQVNNFTQVTCNSVPAASRINDSREDIIMHTVELPNKKTHSPFLYFKELLQIHNMNLMDSAEPTTNMCCIIKFKLRFEQTGIASVTLCLSLLYDKNTFCIQVKDLQSRTLDVNDFSAYWQWEVLKGFRGDVISLMLQNAKKFGNEILEKTTYFVSLLSNIIVLIDNNVNS